MTTTGLDLALVVALVLCVASLGTSRIGAAIRYFSLQAAAIALAPLLIDTRSGGIGVHAWILFGATVVLKVFGVPYLLNRSVREAAVRSEMEPLIGFGTSLALGGGLVALSFALAQKLPLPQKPPSDLLIPVAFSLLMIGLLLIVSRSKAVTQVVGYLVMENGIFLFGLLLIDVMPYLIELGVLLDLFVAVFVMGIVIFHINREFDHIDSHQLDSLKD
jgi:hydrogenase-4 component E